VISIELQSDGGRTIVVKRADPDRPADRARLEREATMLERARHPGVVQLVDRPDDAASDPTGPSPTELRTVFAGARTLAAADLEAVVALRAVASAATTLADLHGVGVVHGRVSPDHIVLADSGRVVLCGFGESGPTGDRRDDGEVLAPSLDVAALGALLTRHVDRWTAGPSDGRRPPVDLSAISRVARRATADETWLRPSARSLAADLDAALPRPSTDGTGRRPHRRAVPRPPQPVDRSTAALGGGIEATSGAGRDDARRVARRMARLLAALGVTLAMALLVFGLSALTGGPGAAGPADPTDPTDPVAMTDATGLADPAGVGRPVPGAGATGQPGGEVVLGGRRFTLGSADDQVLEAAWGCSPIALPVLVRPDGRVFRFDALAQPGHDVTGTAIGQLPAGRPVERVTDGRGCPALQAIGPDGPVVISIDPA
jgi:hypothetical protein